MPEDLTPESVEDPLAGYFKSCEEIVDQVEELVARLIRFADESDFLGAAESHPEGSGKKRLAELRDHADFCLSRAASHLSYVMRRRADSSRSVDLVADSVIIARGDGADCIKLIEKYYGLWEDDTEGAGVIDVESFPDQYLWDLAQRVEAFPALAERYPKHLYFAARHFQGLPMMVSHHIDVTPEFQRLSEILGVGTWHPLDVSPRRKKGGSTPAMRYLEPLIWRLGNLREILHSEVARDGKKIESSRIAWLWTFSYEEKTPKAEIEVLRKLIAFPKLTKTTALIWSKEIVVPYILLTDGADPAASEEPFLRNIWAHRSVKSIPTFRSRLESAVTGFLKRYGREG